MILYTPPTPWSLLRGAAINLLLPFVNGLMLGFGELLAHEVAFQFGWSGTKVSLFAHNLYIFGICDTNLTVIYRYSHRDEVSRDQLVLEWKC